MLILLKISFIDWPVFATGLVKIFALTFFILPGDVIVNAGV